jgi:hypothetical protein
MHFIVYRKFMPSNNKNELYKIVYLLVVLTFSTVSLAAKVNAFLGGISALMGIYHLNEQMIAG